MQKNILKKVLVVGIILLFFGTNIIPSITGDIGNKKEYTILNENKSVSSSTTDWWTMFHHDLVHSGYSTSLGPETNNILWEYKIYNDISSSPAVADGKVYIGSEDRKVYCLNAINGSKIWDYTTGGPIDFSSPAVADEKVYIGSYDLKFYCFGNSSQFPNRPNIEGPIKGLPFLPYNFTFTSSDPEEDDVSYYIDWGDGTTTGWTSYISSGSPGYTESHSWNKPSKFIIRSKAKDINGFESPWSKPFDIDIVQLKTALFFGTFENLSETDDLLIVQSKFFIVFPSDKIIYPSGETIVISKDSLFYQVSTFIFGLGDTAIL